MKWHALLLVWLCGCEVAEPGPAGATDAGAQSSDADGGASELPDPDELPPSPPAEEPSEQAVQYLADSDFELAAMDTGNLKDACTAQAPWGSGSWGIVAATEVEPSLAPIAGSRFVSWGQQGYLYGRDSSGAWGRVRYVQGDVWGFTGCGTVSWRRFAPFAVRPPPDEELAELRLRVDVYQDTDNLLTADDSWSMLAVRLYYSSPFLPTAGNDRNGKKPLVIDYVLALSCNQDSGCNLDDASETPYAWHVQHDRRSSPGVTPGQWQRFETSLGHGLVQAVIKLDWPEYMDYELELYQAEVVLETRNAQAAAIVDNFHIDSSPVQSGE